MLFFFFFFLGGGGHLISCMSTYSFRYDFKGSILRRKFSLNQSIFAMDVVQVKSLLILVHLKGTKRGLDIESLIEMTTP